MLRGELARLGLDGLILTTSDAFQNEEAPDHDRVIRWLTGFTGSLAHALVTPDRAVFLVDGRYTIQAAKQVNGKLWQHGHFHETPLAQWVAGLGAGLRIGYDPMTWTVTQAETLRARAHGVTLVPVADPLAAIWLDRPAMPQAPIREMPLSEAGRSTSDKLEWLRGELSRLGVETWVETRPDNIAWLFNRRGGDVAMNPLALSFAIIGKDSAEWFIDPAKLVIPAPEGVTPRTFDDFLPALSALTGRAAFDAFFTPDAVPVALAQGAAVPAPTTGLITLEKSKKTPEELAGFHRAHLDDAVALAKFCQWLEAEMPLRSASNDPIDEWEVSEKLAGFRAAVPGYQEPSFATIAASGGNAALCHYAPAASGSGTLTPDQILLLDSGGQYDCGTTDVTRTFAFSPVADDIRRISTAVLKGFIALSVARFPVGTFAHSLDALARVPLWQLGLDYDHGTGHDVGHNLLVHEHPHRLAKPGNPVGLVAGNIMTIEPGYYQEGRWGIRIENQVELVEDGPGFLCFKPMTLVPIDLSLFDLAALTTAERAWIDAYHAEVRHRVAPLLQGEVADWLIRHTAPITEAATPRQ
ncbi:aminopeptidase P family protein [Paracoccus sp. PAR01]|uniref:aminopeptidase P family protein n=1 Tax=Paracoccus sp. PAR01 TaxID=2769282 RepID=UPI0017859BA9|nr:aminopeptidase P family protein [Paracoccus sp. PAR01]MBD9528330.1 aminopeptidase P family protein [Paracoccus sp. PAR01]